MTSDSSKDAPHHFVELLLRALAAAEQRHQYNIQQLTTTLL
jgi:hypothetical protein